MLWISDSIKSSLSEVALLREISDGIHIVDLLKLEGDVELSRFQRKSV